MESISRRCLIELACDLCSDWKKLGYVLGLSKEVEQIKQDYKKNVVEQAYRSLQAWREKNGSKATYQSLGAALRQETVSRIDLAEKYCEGGNQGSSETGTLVDFLLTGDLETREQAIKESLSTNVHCAPRYYWRPFSITQKFKSHEVEGKSLFIGRFCLSFECFNSI